MAANNLTKSLNIGGTQYDIGAKYDDAGNEIQTTYDKVPTVVLGTATDSSDILPNSYSFELTSEQYNVFENNSEIILDLQAAIEQELVGLGMSLPSTMRINLTGSFGLVIYMFSSDSIIPYLLTSDFIPNHSAEYIFLAVLDDSSGTDVYTLYCIATESSPVINITTSQMTSTSTIQLTDNQYRLCYKNPAVIFNLGDIYGTSYSHLFFSKSLSNSSGNIVFSLFGNSEFDENAPCFTSVSIDASTKVLTILAKGVPLAIEHEIVLESSQVLALTPPTLQLTDDQYNTLLDNPSVIIDASFYNGTVWQWKKSYETSSEIVYTTESVISGDPSYIYDYFLTITTSTKQAVLSSTEVMVADRLSASYSSGLEIAEYAGDTPLSIYTPYATASQEGVVSLGSAEQNGATAADGVAAPNGHTHGQYALSRSLATVATSGSYNDLEDQPTIPTSVSGNVSSHTHTYDKTTSITFAAATTANTHNHTFTGTTATITPTLTGSLSGTTLTLSITGASYQPTGSISDVGATIGTTSTATGSTTPSWSGTLS